MFHQNTNRPNISQWQPYGFLKNSNLFWFSRDPWRDASTSSTLGNDPQWSASFVTEPLMFERFENIIKPHCNTVQVFVRTISEKSLPRSGLFSTRQMWQPQFMGGVFASAPTLADPRSRASAWETAIFIYGPATKGRRRAFPLKRTKDAEPWRCLVLRAVPDRYDVDPLMPHENA